MGTFGLPRDAMQKPLATPYIAPQALQRHFRSGSDVRVILLIQQEGLSVYLLALY